MNIREIETLTEQDIIKLKEEGKAELLNIKEHNCYLVDLGEYFEYSVLVFKNNKHIYYANDYQLHHRNKSIEELKQWYIKTLNNKLFTESELMEDIQNYDEYKNKSYYVRNYWIMQFERVSIFYIGNLSEEQIIAKEKMFYCSTCFCYVNDKSNKFITHIEESFAKAQENTEVFRKMISYELANHEACITCDYRDTLDSLGLTFDKLTGDQKRIVKEELKKQNENYC